MLTTVGTEPVSLEDLEPFPGNARRGNVDLILDSLRANGQYKPLTVRRHGDALTVLAGNHTLLALLRHEERDRAACAEPASDGPLPADRLPEPGDAEVSHAEPTWGVVVRCGDEAQQTELLERLIAEGLDVRALSVM